MILIQDAISPDVARVAAACTRLDIPYTLVSRPQFPEVARPGVLYGSVDMVLACHAAYRPLKIESYYMRFYGDAVPRRDLFNYDFERIDIEYLEREGYACLKDMFVKCEEERLAGVLVRDPQAIDNFMDRPDRGSVLIAASIKKPGLEFRAACYAGKVYTVAHYATEGTYLQLSYASGGIDRELAPRVAVPEAVTAFATRMARLLHEQYRSIPYVMDIEYTDIPLLLEINCPFCSDLFGMNEDAYAQMLMDFYRETCHETSYL